MIVHIFAFMITPSDEQLRLSTIKIWIQLVCKDAAATGNRYIFY